MHYNLINNIFSQNLQIIIINDIIVVSFFFLTITNQFINIFKPKYVFYFTDKYQSQ